MKKEIKSGTNDFGSYVKCPIKDCSYTSKRLQKHLLVHDIKSTKQFKETFPDCDLVCSDTRKSISENTSKALLNRTEDELNNWKEKFKKSTIEPDSKFRKHLDELNEFLSSPSERLRRSEWKRDQFLNGFGGYKDWASKRGHYYKCGYYESKNNGKIWYRSSYELIVMQWLDFLDIKWQYEKIRVKTKVGGYIADFYLPELQTIIETKNNLEDKKKVILKLLNEQYNFKILLIEGPLIKYIEEYYPNYNLIEPLALYAFYHKVLLIKSPKLLEQPNSSSNYNMESLKENESGVIVLKIDEIGQSAGKLEIEPSTTIMETPEMGMV